MGSPTAAAARAMNQPAGGERVLLPHRTGIPRAHALVAQKQLVLDNTGKALPFEHAPHITGYLRTP